MTTVLQVNGHAPPSDSTTASQESKIQPADVGWQFVPQYYNFVNKQPHRLRCFYNKRSTFVHGEEGEESVTALGQHEIHDRITAIGYDQCKVYIHSIDSQSSANGGIIILVIGEMSNKNQPWRKFTQTFFLAEQPNGYFVLNDIFRYLKEEEEEEEDEDDVMHQDIPVEVPPAAPAPVAAAAPVPMPPTEAPTPVPEAAEQVTRAPEPEPEPVHALAHPSATKVPEEAVIASVPDKNIAPSEPAAAVEEPVTSTSGPIEDVAPAKPAPSPAAVPARPAPAAPAAPTKPAAPKTWASMAASSSAAGPKTWGTVAATPVPASASIATTAPSAAAAPAPKKEEAAASLSATAPGLEGRHPFYVNAMRVNTAQCFVKLPNWVIGETPSGGDTMDEATLRNVASRFGEVARIEIVKQKACAFVEFAKVESARKAIIASLTPAQGGEGGVKADGHGKLNFEMRKDKEDRRPKGGAPTGGGRGGQPNERGGAGGRQGPREEGQNGSHANGERGANGPARGRGRARGGGGDRPAQAK